MNSAATGVATDNAATGAAGVPHSAGAPSQPPPEGGGLRREDKMASRSEQGAPLRSATTAAGEDSPRPRDNVSEGVFGQGQEPLPGNRQSANRGREHQGGTRTRRESASWTNGRYVGYEEQDEESEFLLPRMQSALAGTYYWEQGQGLHKLGASTPRPSTERQRQGAEQTDERAKTNRSTYHPLLSCPVEGIQRQSPSRGERGGGNIIVFCPPVRICFVLAII